MKKEQKVYKNTSFRSILNKLLILKFPSFFPGQKLYIITHPYPTHKLTGDKNKNSIDKPFQLNKMVKTGGLMKQINKEGVTLIELIVVLVIIAIGAVLLAPNIGVWLPNYRLRSATRDIISTLRTANMRAISTNLEYRVQFDANPPARYWMERGNQSSNSTVWTTEGSIHELPTGVTINFTGDIEFNPDSTCNTQTLVLTNSKGKQSRITLVSSTGKVNVSY